MRIFGLLLVAMCLTAPALRAEESVYEKFNFAFEWPAGEGWVPLAPPEHSPPQLLRITLANEGLGRTVSLVVMKAHPSASMRNAAFVRAIKAGFTRKGPDLSITSDVVEPFAGVPALKMWANIPTDEGAIRAYTIQFAVAGLHYMLAANSQTVEDGTDAALEGALQSFRFLKPPTDTPPAMEEEDLASRVGYAVGYYGIPVLILLAFVHRLRYNAAQRRKDEEDRAYL